MVTLQVLNELMMMEGFVRLPSSVGSSLLHQTLDQTQREIIAAALGQYML